MAFNKFALKLIYSISVVAFVVHFWLLHPMQDIGSLSKNGFMLDAFLQFIIILSADEKTSVSQNVTDPFYFS